jgi:transposase InsO family protein
VWSYDFMSAMTHDGRTLRMLTLIDEYTRECLAIRVARRLGSYEIIEALADVMLWRGIPENIRSDNGPEFVARELRKWLGNLVQARSISSQEVPGRTATAKASMASCEMSV